MRRLRTFGTQLMPSASALRELQQLASSEQHRRPKRSRRVHRADSVAQRWFLAEAVLSRKKTPPR